MYYRGVTFLNQFYAGAGIHVFRGASTGNLQVPGSLPNNGIVISLNTTGHINFRFFCRSDSMMSNVGMLIGPDGTTVTTGDVFDISRAQPGELRVENNPLLNYVLTASDQGVYTCRIPLQSGEMRDINVGIYPSGFNSKDVKAIHVLCCMLGANEYYIANYDLELMPYIDA